MKQLLTLSMGLLLAVFTFAQAPQQISYQAVIRNAAGDPITNTLVPLRFSVRTTTPTGTIVYRETHSPTTNDYGLVNLTVGSGTADIGTMSSINWESTSHYLEVEQDPGSGYVSMGTSQMMSVPYALYAEEAKVASDNTIDGDGTSTSPLEIAQQGASTGDVLKWNGTTWLPAQDDDSNCNTLDESYDCGDTPGVADRVISVDDGSVKLNASGHIAMKVVADANQDGIEITNSNVQDGIDITSIGVGHGVNIDKTGNGDGVNINHDNNGDGVDVAHNGAGEGVIVNHAGAGDGVEVVHNGTGDGVFVTQNGPGSSVSITHNGNLPGIDVLNNGGSIGMLVTSNGAGVGIDVTQVAGSGNALDITQNSNAIGVLVNHNGDGDGINISKPAGVDGEAIAITQNGISNAIEITQNNAADAVRVTQNGVGGGMYILQNGAANGLVVVQAANGVAGSFAQPLPVASDCVEVNGRNTAAAINSTQFGGGDGIKSSIVNPANGSQALDITTNGTGKAAVISQTNGASFASVLEVTNSGVGTVAELVQLNPGAPSPTFSAATMGMGAVAIFEQGNAANGTPAIMATNEGPGHVMKLDQLNPTNGSPTLVATNAGLGSSGRFESMNPANNEPTVDVFNMGVGHVGLFESAGFLNDDYAVKVISHNLGGGLHVDGDNPATETLASFEYFSPGPAAGTARVAHFSQVASGSPDEVVLISKTGGSAPALKVTTPGASGYAGEFNGDVDVTGDLDVGGLLDAGAVTASIKMFRIDHPLDPANKLLQHACIESNEMMNLYSGNVVLNQNGEATIELPTWFEALNTDARYQLTCVGGFANVFIKEKLSGNRFAIGGGYEGLEVSWQLTAVRHDKFALDNPLQVEKDKEVKR